MNFVNHKKCIEKDMGSALIEFSLVLPFFMLFVLLAIDVAILVVTRSQIDFVANEAVRKASTQSYDCSTYALTEFNSGLATFGITPEDADISSCYQTRNATNEYDGPYNLYTYIDLNVNVEISCFFCDMTLGLLNDFKTIDKTYDYLLPGLNPVCYDPTYDCPEE